MSGVGGLTGNGTGNSGLKLYLIPYPRSIVLVSTSTNQCLIFRPPPIDSPLSVIVELLPLTEINFDTAVPLNYKRPVYGTLGVIRLQDQTFIPIITSITTIKTSTRAFNGLGTEPISKLLAIDFYCLTSSSFDLSAASTTDLPPPSSSSSISTIDDVTLTNDDRQLLEHPCAGIRKVLNSGTFYFSPAGNSDFDPSTRLESRLTSSSSSSLFSISDSPTPLNTDPQFTWNLFLLSPLLSFRSSLPLLQQRTLDDSNFLVHLVQGYWGSYDLTLGSGELAVLSLISRLSCKRAGTRFNVRGVDEEGNVANFVETETILRTKDTVFSYVQIRGSVPVFWEEVGLQPFGLKISLTRPIESSLPAFIRHFSSLSSSYAPSPSYSSSSTSQPPPPPIHIINLLSSEKDGEAMLSDSYENHLAASGLGSGQGGGSEVGYSAFDFHARSRTGGIESVKRQLEGVVGFVGENFGATLVEIGESGQEKLITKQKGVFRTNCKDCLDRTNVVQDVLSRFALEDFIRNSDPNWGNSGNPSWGDSSILESLWSAHRVLWAENGDALSKIYVGTGAINTSFTRSGKKSLAGILSDATKSVGRMYQSNFQDGGKQKSIDALLGLSSSSQKLRVYNPINDLLQIGLEKCKDQYTSFDATTIWVGTYNLNGKGPGSESLLPWLFPAGDGPEPSLLVISFQEIVPLTPQMIMATDPEKKRRWEAHILQTVTNRPGKKSEYILLRSGQLVGTALIVLIKASLADDVRNVEVATKKTGLKGMAGNKGAVAIRLDFRDTSFCFLTAHLAAGHSSVELRNSDYFTIAEGVRFSRGKTLTDHENVVWASDTNYRISLPNEEVRQLAEVDAYDALAEGDQLVLAMHTRGVFSGYTEGPLIFRPTYKYDNGTDNYDTSEKRRIPAWTDRILYRGDALDLSRYQRAELLASDHRPVYAILRARIRTIDRPKRAALRQQLLQEILAESPEDKIDDKVTHMLETTSFPLPSDDQQQWWIVQADPLLGVGVEDQFSRSAKGATRNPSATNPFDENYYVLSKTMPSPRALPTSKPGVTPISPVKRKAPPPRPTTRAGPAFLGTPAPPLPARPGVRRSSSASSLLDSDDGLTTTENWQVIEANAPSLQ